MKARVHVSEERIEDDADAELGTGAAAALCCLRASSIVLIAVCEFVSDSLS